MGDQVEAEEDEEDAEGEAGDDFHALEAEGVADGAAAPDVEVVPDLDEDAEHGAEGVVEDEVGEGFHCGARVGGPGYVGGDGHVG